MQARYIETYHYCDKNNEEKDNYYRNHKLTDIEKNKTDEIMQKMKDFVIKTRGEELLEVFSESIQGNIEYREGLGYISVGNFDRDEVDVLYYGNTIDEAFIPAMIDYEFYLCENDEWENRQELNKQFSERFLNGKYSENDYHGPFFFAELALQDFRKYYGDNIPEEIIDHYELYIAEVCNDAYKYDYETNRLIAKVKHK